MSRILEQAVASYEAFSPTSKAHIEEARRCFPGGDTRMSAHYPPYPLFIERGAGCTVHDADGHALVDFMNNFTSLIHGHAEPSVVEAVHEQMQRGSAYAAPTRSQIELATDLIARLPSVDQLRFTASGSEATLMTLRCARAATGRQKIMKMEGGYHGSYEQGEVSLVPFPQLRGDVDHPNSVAVDPSFPENVLENTVVCPYNQPEHARALIAAHADELAAVIVEPMLGSMGMIPATREFLAVLREETARLGIVLVFDEVITLRCGDGGLQTELGITPDLTAMGKIIGGGLPIGAFGGREDLMALFHPDRRDAVMHASTFSGNPVSMAAGAAAMKRFHPQEKERLNGLGERLRTGFSKAFADVGIVGTASGAGSLANLHVGAAAVQDARGTIDAMAAAGTVGRAVHLGMLERGYMSASRLMYSVSTPMTEATIDGCIDAFADTLTTLKPLIQAERPALLA